MVRKRNKKKNNTHKENNNEHRKIQNNFNIPSELSMAESINMNKDVHGVDQIEKYEPSCGQSSKSPEIIARNILDNNNEMQNMNMLEVMDKILICLKSKEKKMFINIFENILNVLDLEVNKRKITQKLICSFLNTLEECESIDLDFVSQKFKSTIVPKGLRQLVVDNSELTELQYIGSGAFGVVRFGYLHKNNLSTSVAIKQPKSENDFDVLENEAKVMCKLDHPNILKLLAIQKTPFRIVIEYMPLGNIRDAIEDKHFSDGELLKVLQDVASGMEYLEEKKIVHRDLGCRNIFVDDSANKIVCKVGDFGTCSYVGDTNGVYEEKEHTFFQIGMPPEAIRSQQFSTKSDVYSMGILIWELYMAAGYQTPEIPFIPFLLPFSMGRINFILKLFAETGHIEKPRRINDELFKFVKNKMLHKYPERRPTFTEVKEEVNQLINK